MIQPERDYPRTGLERGKLYTVVDAGPGNRLSVRSEGGSTLSFCPLHHRQLSVYSAERAELSAGDRVRITRNDAARDLANGDRFRVVSASPTEISLTDERRVVTLPASRVLHLEHAYSTTIHSSQGTTAERVLFDANTHSRTTAQDVFYVAVSRARSEVHVYTDSRKDLPDAVARETPKYAAYDVTRPRGPAGGPAEGANKPASEMAGPRTGADGLPEAAIGRAAEALGSSGGAGGQGAGMDGPTGGMAGGAGGRG